MPIKSSKELCSEAEREVERLTAAELMEKIDSSDTLIVDIRDTAERWKHGTIPSSIHATRGMLEFLVDPEGSYHDARFSSGKRTVFFCGGGLRSALAARDMQRLGLRPVAHLTGGMEAWVQAGGPVEQVEPEFPSAESSTDGAS